MKLLNLYPEDFRNINDWYAVCDQLKVDYNALVIDIYYNKRQHEWSSSGLRKLILEKSENK